MEKISDHITKQNIQHNFDFGPLMEIVSLKGRIIKPIQQ